MSRQVEWVLTVAGNGYERRRKSGQRGEAVYVATNGVPGAVRLRYPPMFVCMIMVMLPKILTQVM